MDKRVQAGAAAALAVFLIAGSAGEQEEWKQSFTEAEAWEMESLAEERSLYAGVAREFGEVAQIRLEPHRAETIAAAPEGQSAEEESIYTFLQGPKSWEEGRPWSGEWSGRHVRGNYFGSFGCGLCCMANIYATHTGYVCSPWDMFEYAKRASNYYPTGESGAIGWEDMSAVLQKSGFATELRRKPDSYEAFLEEIRKAKSAVVLVSSRNDDAYWKHTGGHYVNIFLYNDKTEEAFLADPGSPDRNRSRIPVRYVYDALKTVSQYQYLLVQGYSEEDNLWKQDGIDEAWNAP